MAPGEEGTDLLPSALRTVADRAEQHRGQKIGEQNTKAALVEPVLRALGWETENVDEVRREYKRRPQDKPVDYALMLNREPALFVEAKGLDEDLADRRWASQIISYASVAGVAWVALTDGDEYRIYNAHAPVPVEDKLFRRARLSKDFSEAQESLSLLSKERMIENTLAELWKADRIDRQVREAVESLFVPEPSPWLVRRLAQLIDDLTQGEIRTALSRTRITLDIPAATRPLSHRARREPEGRQRGLIRREPKPEGRPKPRRVGVTLLDLLGADLIKPPLDLTKTYLDRELRARVRTDGRVQVGDEVFDSLSVAAGVARAAVRGAPPGRKYPQTNGWTFWRFRDDDGEWKEMDVLRQRYLERETRSAAMSPVVSEFGKEPASG